MADEEAASSATPPFAPKLRKGVSMAITSVSSTSSTSDAHSDSRRRGNAGDSGSQGVLGRLLKRSNTTRTATRRRTRLIVNETTWDGASKIIQPMGDTVIAVAISRDERHFACGGADKKIAIYTCHTGQEHCTFATKAGINAVLFSAKTEDTLLIAGTVRAPQLRIHTAQVRPTRDTRRAASRSAVWRPHPPLQF